MLRKVSQMSIQNEIRSNPVDEFKIDCHFGWRIHPITKAKDFHNGIDIKLPLGTKCYAIADGKILISQFHVSLGWYLVIEHKAFLTVYAHLKERGMAVGKLVFAGDIVGCVGATGTATGAHLHFEIREGSYRSDSYFWNRGKDHNAQYPNAIDPEILLSDVPSYIKTIKATQKNPEKWLAFIDEFKTHPMGKYLPQMIDNIRNSYEK